MAICDWSIRNHLPLCTEKSARLHYGFLNRQFAYNINGEAIRSVTEYAGLGILRTTDFDYRKHMDKSCLKAAMLSRVFSSRDRNAQMRLFGAFLRPLVEYASPVWSPLEVGLTSQIEYYVVLHVNYLAKQHRIIL